jgi:heat shock protein HslJ
MDLTVYWLELTKKPETEDVMRIGLPFCLATVVALLSGCAMSNTQFPQPRLEDSAWLTEDIDGAGVVDNLQSTLKFDVNLNVSGNGGCNRYFGAATVDENKIDFGALSSTRMACSQAILDQEQRFFAALDAARTWQIDAERELLYMKNEEGYSILRFSRLTTPD